MNYWLLKSEPETYSFDTLVQEKRTHWDGVRNFQARNFLRAVKKGDLALIYHSGKQKSVVGIAEVIREGYPDVDPDAPGEWTQIDLQAVRPLPHAIPLSAIKQNPALQSLLLIKQARLSVMPVSNAHYQALLKMGGL